jgi:hypothetical protein
MAFVSTLQTFLEFTEFCRLLSSFLTLKMFLVLFKFIEFTVFYHYAPKFTSFLYRLAINRSP